jgi:hypothetical protein
MKPLLIRRSFVYLFCIILEQILRKFYRDQKRALIKTTIKFCINKTSGNFVLAEGLLNSTELRSVRYIKVGPFDFFHLWRFFLLHVAMQSFVIACYQ